MSKENARTSNSKSPSRFAANVKRKRQSKRPDIVEPNITSSASNNQFDSNDGSSDRNEIGDNSSISNGNGESIESISRRSGTNGRDGRDGRDGRNGSGNSSDNSTTTERISARTGKPVRRYTKRTANAISEDIFLKRKGKAPKFLGEFDEDIKDGFQASVLVLAELIQTGSELAAIIAAKDYVKFEKSESKELSEAWLETLDALPAKWRKLFDKAFSKYYPFWKLATVAGKIAYPRYVMFQLEMEMKKEAAKQNVRPFKTAQTNSTNFDQNESIETDSIKRGYTN